MSQQPTDAEIVEAVAEKVRASIVTATWHGSNPSTEIIRAALLAVMPTIREKLR